MSPKLIAISTIWVGRGREIVQAQEFKNSLRNVISLPNPIVCAYYVHVCIQLHILIRIHVEVRD